MGAKQSQEMKKALALVASGMSVAKAAKESGVVFQSVHRALKKIAEKDKKNLA